MIGNEKGKAPLFDLYIGIDYSGGTDTRIEYEGPTGLYGRSSVTAHRGLMVITHRLAKIITKF